MLYFSKEIYNEIISHAEESYPHEACGALVGEQKQGVGESAQRSGIGKNVLKSRRLENMNKDRANDRYEINPKELLQVEKEASLNGLEIIGFYHSHPDHPDRPSSFDRERAWPLYSYVIISVQNGKTASVKSWTFEDEKEAFKEEEVRVS
ncbi:MAG: M67 family metallopeptidase [Deltaproteobacteria bacterium]|nr:M67 family metallopeptidase [Deltaproteobacteria bacterium]